METLRLARNIAAFACAAALSLSLAACGSHNESGSAGAAPDISDTSGGVAATVNGTDIGENAVSSYVANFRNLNSLNEDTDWAQWMVDNGYTAEDLRKEVINYYVSQELVRQAAEQNNVTVDEDAVDEQLNTMKMNYDSDGDGSLNADETASWNKALQAVGIASEDEYRTLLEMYSLEASLQKAVVPDTAPSDEDMLQYAQMYATAYDGAKKSSHILFASDDQATAQEILDKINSGELDFAEAAKQYSTDTASAADGGNVGWDVLNSFVKEYTDALSGLGEGEVSGLVTSEYGIHIIKCTQVFKTPEEVTSVDQIPSEWLDSIKASLQQANKTSAYKAWFKDFYDSADITVNDMPEGLPYDVDLTGYTPAAGSPAASTSAGAPGSAPSDGSAAAGASGNGGSASTGGASASSAAEQPSETAAK